MLRSMLLYVRIFSRRSIYTHQYYFLRYSIYLPIDIIVAAYIRPTVLCIIFTVLRRYNITHYLSIILDRPVLILVC